MTKLLVVGMVELDFDVRALRSMNIGPFANHHEDLFAQIIPYIAIATDLLEKSLNRDDDVFLDPQRIEIAMKEDWERTTITDVDPFDSPNRCDDRILELSEALGV